MMLSNHVGVEEETDFVFCILLFMFRNYFFVFCICILLISNPVGVEEEADFVFVFCILYFHFDVSQPNVYELL